MSDAIFGGVHKCSCCVPATHAESINGAEPGVAVYIDDVLVFSCTLEEYFENLWRVIERIQELGLKLKSAKC